MKLAELHKRRIAAAMTLPKDVSQTNVLQQIEGALELFSEEMGRESGARFKDATVRGRILKITFNRYKLKGAPRKAAIRAYIMKVAVIYEKATGKRLGRNVDADTHQESPHPFLLACTKMASIRYPRGIVREVLVGLHASIKERGTR